MILIRTKNILIIPIKGEIKSQKRTVPIESSLVDPMSIKSFQAVFVKKDGNFESLVLINDLKQEKYEVILKYNSHLSGTASIMIKK